MAFYPENVTITPTEASDVHMSTFRSVARRGGFLKVVAINNVDHGHNVIVRFYTTKGNPLTARNGSGGRTHLEGEYYISNTHKNELPTWEDFKTNDTRINYIPMDYKKGDEGIRFAHLEPVTD